MTMAIDKDIKQIRTLSSDEAAYMLGVSRATIHRYINQRGLPCFLIGNRIRLREEDILAWYEDQRI